MANRLGPVLQFRGVAQGEGGQARWRLSALVVCDGEDAAPQAQFKDAAVTAAPAVCIARIPLEAPTRAVWRIDFSAPIAGQTLHYDIAGVAGSLSVPAAGVSPRMAYGSCNGFSDPKLMKQVDVPNGRWIHLAGRHAEQPYQLLLLGGDQIYSDEMWKTVPELAAWLTLDKSARLKAAFNRTMRKQVDALFARLYVDRWSQPEVAQMLAAIPTIMMWDDHDIMDGWGSYPAELHSCPVYQGIFDVARRYFRIFQWQCAEDETHPCAIAGQRAFSLGYTGLGDIAILAPDLRSERQPALPDASGKLQPDRIVSQQSWTALYAWLAQPGPAYRHLLFMSSIPVAYLDLGAVEKLLDTLPGQQELEDDLRDHWRSPAHLQERLRLVHRLLDHAATRPCRVTIISGDVHVGALSVIESTRAEHAGRGAVINQLVSTGIVHPAPPAIVRYVLEHIGNGVDPVDRGITATMQPISGRGRYLIGARNWLALEPDDQARIWANWHVEGMDQPLTKVIHG